MGPLHPAVRPAHGAFGGVWRGRERPGVAGSARCATLRGGARAAPRARPAPPRVAGEPCAPLCSDGRGRPGMPGGRGGRPAASSTVPCPSPVVWAPPDELEGLAASLGIGFERARAGMALLDLDGRVARANRSMAELLGRSAAELAGRNMLSLVRREDRAELAGGVAAALASGADAALRPGQRCVLVGGRGSGRAVEVAADVTVLRDAYGAALALLVECRQEGGDEERRRAERQRQSLLRQLV